MTRPRTLLEHHHLYTPRTRNLVAEIERFEESPLHTTLTQTRGNASKPARLLETSRDQVRYKIIRDLYFVAEFAALPFS